MKPQISADIVKIYLWLLSGLICVHLRSSVAIKGLFYHG